MTEREIPRVTQLTQKTNQFNLTTRRYTEAEILAIHGNEKHAVYTLSVKDKYGDFGLTGIMIVENLEKIQILSFLMSCRILGKKIEFTFAGRAIGLAREKFGKNEVSSIYIPTKKNSQTAEFWPKCGFIPTKTEGSEVHFELK